MEAVTYLPSQALINLTSRRSHFLLSVSPQKKKRQIKLMIATVLSAIPVLKLLAHHHGLVGVWLSLIFVQGVRAVGLSRRLWRDQASPLTLRRDDGQEVVVAAAAAAEKGLVDLDRLLPALRALPGQARQVWMGLRQRFVLLVDVEERERRRREQKGSLATEAAAVSTQKQRQEASLAVPGL